MFALLKIYSSAVSKCILDKSIKKTEEEFYD